MDTPIRRLAAKILTAAVRGGGAQGGEWGEAVLAEFDRTTGNREAIRWAAGGLRTVWRERRGRIRALPRGVRLRRRALRTAMVGLLAGLAVNQWVLTVGVMLSGSMEPTLRISDHYLMDKAAFHLTGLHRDDVVVVADGEHTLVKRVIGLPGDVISCRDGTVLRNGTPLDEPYLTDVSRGRTDDCGDPVTVPPDRLYLLGDHRTVSLDSRRNGTVGQDAVQARIITVVWPL